MSEPRIITFGCRLNAYESEVMRGHARDAGLTDAVIINTCAVTAESERQARQAIRKARRENPTAKIVVTGCAAQIDPQGYGAMAEVDLVLGNEEKLRLESFLPDQGERVQVNDIMAVTETAPHLIDGYEERTRAFVQVQQGCDHRCTFCIIPYGRGNSRSVPKGEVVQQVRTLARSGVAEVVMTGVDVTSYGGDLPGQPTLGQMLRRLLAQVPELPRLRPLLHRRHRTGRRHLPPAGRGAPLHAAPASVAAVGRRHDPEAHEAAPFPRRCRGAL